MHSLFKKAVQNPTKIAIISDNQAYTYAQLLEASASFTHILLDKTNDLNEKRVAFMVSPGFDYVKTQWAIWQAGGVAVPLCITYPLPSLQYVIEDTAAEIVVVSKEYEDILKALAQEKGFRYIVIPDFRFQISNSNQVLEFGIWNLKSGNY